MYLYIMRPNGVSVFPTPAIAMVGLNSDARKSLPSSFQEPENHIILIGETNMDFGGLYIFKELFWRGLLGRISQKGLDFYHKSLNPFGNLCNLRGKPERGLLETGKRNLGP